VTFAISAAWELGFLDALQEQESVEIEAFASEHDLHRSSVRAIAEALGCGEIVVLDEDGVVRPGPIFAEVFATKGFFYWLTRGCGELFSVMPSIIPNAARQGDYYHRDLRAVGVACRDMGYQFFDAPFFSFLDEIDFEIAADLGCGSGERLIRMATDRPDLHGVGVDISANALELAHEAIAAAGMDDRIALVRADARQLSPLRVFEDVDLLTCFLMGHDFWPREQCIGSLRAVRRAFPNVEHFILCDTYRSGLLPSAAAPLFTPGFEVAHALMGVELPTLADWHGVFKEAGWELVEQRDLPVPSSTSMFILQPG